MLRCTFAISKLNSIVFAAEIQRGIVKLVCVAQENLDFSNYINCPDLCVEDSDDIIQDNTHLEEEKSAYPILKFAGLVNQNGISIFEVIRRDFRCRKNPT